MPKISALPAASSVNTTDEFPSNQSGNTRKSTIAQLITSVFANIGASVIGIVNGGTGATTASAARTNLGSGATGDQVFVAPSQSTARVALGVSATGDSLFTSASTAAARSTLSVPSTSEIQNQTYTAVTTGGTGTAYTISPSPSISAYTAGQAFYVNFSVVSGDQPTLQINGLGGPPNLVRQNPDGTYSNIRANEIPANHHSIVILLSNTQAWIEDMPVVAAPSSTLSFRNKVRNPRMDIAQRGTSFAAIASGAYSLDGWKYVSTSSGVVTVSQQADTPSDNEFQNSLRVTVTTADAAVAAGDLVFIQQPIEGYLVRDCIGRPMSILFRVKSAKTGTHCVALQNSGQDRSYILTYNISVANTWQTVSLAFPEGLITSGTWNWTNGVGVTLSFVLMAGSTYQTTANTWQTGNFFATNAQVNVMDTNTNIFAITGVQVERGSYSSTFEHRDYSAEWVLNSRYMQLVAAASTGTVYNTTTAGFAWQLPVEMRTAPTMVANNSSPNFINAPSGGGAVVAGTWSPGNITTRSFVGLHVRTAGTWTAGQPLTINDTSSPVLLTAEL